VIPEGAIILAAGSVPTGTLLILLGGLIVAVVILGLVMIKVRGATLGKAGTAVEQEGLLAGLRRLRDRGEISPEEYDAARRSMVSRAAGTKPPPKPGGQVARPGFDLTGEPLPPQKPESGE
jgi:hypothetical protein